MQLATTEAPFCDSGGTQRGKKARLLLPPEMALYREERYRPSRATTRVGRSRGSREQTARSRRKSYFVFGLLLIVVALAYCGWFPGSRSPSPEVAAAATNTRARPQKNTASSWPTETLEEETLRREISILEESLRRKKLLLGTASGVPLDGSLGVDDSPHGGVGGGAEAPSMFDISGATLVGGARFPEADHSSSPHENPSSPRAGAGAGAGAGARGGAGAGAMTGGGAGAGAVSSAYLKGVAGEAMFGEKSVRPSLESKSGLIREPVPLVVGGTDGSGTRGVVALLQRLKVPMIVEDAGTMDIHASPYMVKGGWPEVVQPVLKWAHGAGYDTQAAPAALRKTTIIAMGRLRTQMDKVSSFDETAATATYSSTCYSSTAAPSTEPARFRLLRQFSRPPCRPAVDPKTELLLRL